MAGKARQSKNRPYLRTESWVYNLHRRYHTYQSDATMVTGVWFLDATNNLMKYKDANGVIQSLAISGGYAVTLVTVGYDSSITLDKQTFEVEGEGTATRLMKLVNAADAAATLTISGILGAINQDVQSTASPTFVRVVTGAGTLAEPAIKIGAAANGLYEISSTQLGVSIGDALATTFEDDGVHSDATFLRVAPGTLASGGATVKHYGDGKNITSVFTLTDYVVGPLAGAAAALTLVPPEALFVFPAGAHVLEVSSVSVGLTATGTAVTPEIGLGSVVGDGSANATIGAAGATMEDIVEGFAVADTDTHAVVSSGPVGATAGILTGIALNGASDSKNVFVNCAGTWNADNTGNLRATGTIVIKWTIM